MYSSGKDKAIRGDKKHDNDTGNVDMSAPVNMDVLRRARHYEVVALVFMILMMFLPGGYALAFKSSISSAQSSCWKYEQTVEALANQYVTVNGLSSYPAYVEDIPSFNEIQSQCPKGGSYTWNPITGEYSCSVHQHYPEGFNSSQSINEGTTVTTRTNDNGN